MSGVVWQTLTFPLTSILILYEILFVNNTNEKTLRLAKGDLTVSDTSWYRADKCGTTRVQLFSMKSVIGRLKTRPEVSFITAPVYFLDFVQELSEMLHGPPAMTRCEVRRYPHSILRRHRTPPLCWGGREYRYGESSGKIERSVKTLNCVGIIEDWYRGQLGKIVRLDEFIHWQPFWPCTTL